MQVFRSVLCIGLLFVSVGFVMYPLGSTSTIEQQSILSQRDAAKKAFRDLNQEAKRIAREGKYAQAAKLFQRGYEESVAAEIEEAATTFLINLANCQSNQYQFRAAIETYQKAIPLAERSEKHEFVAILAANLAALYLAQGAQLEAEDALRESASAVAELEDSEHLGRLLILQGKLRAEKGDTEEAVSLFRQAVNTADRVGDEATLTWALDLLGFELLEAGQVEEAEGLFRRAERRRRKRNMPTPDASFRNMSLLRLAQGDLDSAEQMIDLAFEATRETSHRVMRWVLYHTRSRIRLARGDIQGAYQDAEAALQLVRRLRLALLPADSVRTSARVGLDQVYSTYVEAANRLYKRSGRKALARRSFEVAEQSRAIALREGIEEAETFRDRLSPAYWGLLDQLRKAEAALFVENATHASSEVDRLSARLTEMEIAANLEGERLNTATLQPVPSTLVQQQLSDSEALFSFQSRPQGSYLWALTRACFELHTVDGSDKIAAEVETFRQSIETGRTAEAAVTGERLHNRLFGKVSREILDKQNWIILPDGPLFEAPISALVSGRRADGRPVYVVENHSYRILPSAAFLLNDAPTPWQGPMVAVGDPIYNSADPRWQPIRAPARGWRGWVGATDPAVPSLQLTRLAASVREARAVAAAFRNNTTPVLLIGTDVNMEDFRTALDTRPSVVHLATHVVPSPGDPLVGHLAFSLRPNGETELLSATTLSKLDVNAQLVVMSGCSSGSGKPLPGEGLWGLTRAWLRAGTREVAATLWSIDDTSGELLPTLYRYLGSEDGTTRAPHRALQLAQIDMLRSDGWRSRPSYWAAYFVVARN